MTGPPWSQVRAAVRSLASSLPASDGLEVRLFTARLGEPLLAVEPGRLSPGRGTGASAGSARAWRGDRHRSGAGGAGGDARHCRPALPVRAPQ